MPDTGNQSAMFSWGGHEEKASPSFEQLISRMELLQLRYRTREHDRESILKSITE